MQTHRLFPSLLGLYAAVATFAADNNPATTVPFIDGDWWTIAGQPDLGELASPRQQPVDFTIWPARDGTWQLWSCIRYTGDPQNLRVLYRWESPDLFATHWTPRGIAQKSDASLGETQGTIGAPYVFKDDDDRDVMFYHSAGFRAQVSDDGKSFTRVYDADGGTRLTGPKPGTYGRDVFFLKINDRWHVYYGGSTPGPDGKHAAAIFVRVAQGDSLFGEWGEEFIVNSGGRAGSGNFNAECPQVIVRDGWFYLFRTELYGADNRTHVYRSRDPYHFGINSDAYHVAVLPIAAPEIFTHDGQEYVATLHPTLDGIRVARLGWRPQAADSGPRSPVTRVPSEKSPVPTLAPETLLLAEADAAGAHALGAHTIFQAADGSWQLWSILHDPNGTTRLGRWETTDFFTDQAWRWTGDTLELPGATASAPFGLAHDGGWWLMYPETHDTRPDGALFALTSTDGRNWSAREKDQPPLFTGPGAVRDPAFVRIKDRWHCYYSGNYGGAPANAAIFVRTSPDLRSWSEAVIAHEDHQLDPARRADAHGSPAVVQHRDHVYLFRPGPTEDGTAGTRVHRSSDPLNFGRGHMDNKWIGRLPLVAPEHIRGPDGQDYVTSVDPAGARTIRMYRLLWD